MSTIQKRPYWTRFNASAVSSKSPTGDENAHRLIQSYAQQPQTVVVPVVPY